MTRLPLRALVAGALVTAVTVATPLAAHATSTVTTSRIAGGDRYETAAMIAEAKFPTGADNAIVASGLNFPDALAAGYLAGVDGAPILLSDPATLLAELKSALATLRTRNVIIVGGTAAVSDDVATAIGGLTSTSAMGGDIAVTRVAGASRYDTMQMIDTAPPATDVGVYQGKATAIIAQGLDFADALSASAVSFKDHLPVILTDPSVLPEQAVQTLQSLNIGQVLIMGGTAAVSPAVEQSITALGIATLKRFSGVDRTDTAQQFDQFAVANLQFTNNEVVLTRGDSFADALAGGVYAGDPKPILLTLDPNTLGSFTSNYLTTFASAINRITVLGGEAAETDSTVHDAAVAAGSDTDTLGGGGGNGGGGGVFPANTVTTAAPDLVSASIDLSNPTTTYVKATFDKSVIVNAGTVLHTRLVGPSTNGGPTSVSAPSQCVNEEDGVSVTCIYLQADDPAQSTVVFDGGAVVGANGLPNVLSTVVLGGGNANNFPGPLLVSAAVTSVAFNQVTYTFNQQVFVNNPALFGFVTDDGQTENIGATSAVPSANAVTVTFPSSNAVAQGVQFFALTGAVVGTLTYNNPDTAVGTVSWRPNLVSVTRTPAPQQFTYTFDRPVNPSAVGDFMIWDYPTGTPVAAVAAAPLTSTVILVTFPTAQVNANTTSLYTLGSADQTIPPTIPPAQPTPNGGAVVAAANPNDFNAIQSVTIGGSTTQVSNGPTLQAFSASIGASQGTFTFDRPIVQASVVAGDFFLVLNDGLVRAGSTVISSVNNVVIIGFTPGIVTPEAVGGGLISPTGSQPGVRGGAFAPATDNTDAAGNPPLPGSVPGVAAT